MPEWRNWQTRRFQVPVGDRAGSSPATSTKKPQNVVFSNKSTIFAVFSFTVLPDLVAVPVAI